MVVELGKTSEITETKTQDVQKGVSEIKPDSNITMSEAKKFWDNVGKVAETKAELHELTPEDKVKIMKETGWSKNIVDCIKYVEEAEIYMNAHLVEAEVDGRKCLIRTDIDPEQKDEFGQTNKERMQHGLAPISKDGENGQTNKERMQHGLAPISKDGEKIELHHIGQKNDGPLAELTFKEHHGTGNDTILHVKQKPSEIDHVAFIKEKTRHWESRAQNI